MTGATGEGSNARGNSFPGLLRILTIFVIALIFAWALQYPAYLVAEALHLGGYAIGGFLFRGYFAGFTLTPDLMPWNLTGSITIAGGDTPDSRILVGPLSCFFLFPAFAAILVVLVSYMKPKKLGMQLLAGFFELLVFWAGFALYKEAQATLQNADMADVVNTLNSAFITIFQAILVLASVIGLGLVIYYIIKWLLAFIAGVGLVKKSSLWHPYVISFGSLILAAILYFVSSAPVLAIAPYVMLIAFVLSLFTIIGFPKKDEMSAPEAAPINA